MVNEFKNKPASDEYLLKLLCKSPKEGFRLLFDTYHMKLCLYALQLTDEFEMSEDIVQDVFVYFWEKKSYLNIHTDLRNYLFFSVRNAAFKALRKKNMLSMEELSGINMGIPEEESAEERQKRIESLSEKLKILTPREMSVVKAVIMENKKYKEAAEELNISVNTLKTYLVRALKRLRQKYNLLLLF